MTKACFTAVLMLTCLFVDGISARAQGADTVVVSVPFEFVAGGATLPAGKYRVSRVSPGMSPELSISDGDKDSVFLLPVAFDDGNASEPTLSFDHVGGKYFLSKIKTLTGVYTMPASREMVMLGKANSPSPSISSASGGQ
jgi:hypothetical protein